MLPSELALYHLARVLYRGQLAHSESMKQALSDRERHAEYRSVEVRRVRAAADRFGLSIAGRDVLDLGCNDGALTRQYAALGARSVIGCDVDADAIASAQRMNAHAHAEFRVSGTTGLPLDDNSIDLILCYDVFEHVSKPDLLLAECRRALRPGGSMLIGTWGWYHPFAPHLWSTMPVPWAHLLVSERTLLRACRRVYNSAWYVPTFHDLDANGQRRPEQYSNEAISTDYLNKYLVRDFERVFRKSALRWTLTLQPFGSRWANWTRPLLRVPYAREFCHGYLWAVLTKSDDLSSVR